MKRPFGFLAVAGSLLAGTPVIPAEPLWVDVVVASYSTDEKLSSLTGEIVARDQLSASFPVGGRIVSIFVDDGDVVQAGMKLAQLESIQQEQALRAAKAGVVTAEADAQQAQIDFDRQDALLERGATTRIARDNAEDSLTVANGELAQANSELDQAEKALADTVILAPESAIVIDRQADPGEVIGAAQPLFDLALGGKFDAVFDVPETLVTAYQRTGPITMTLVDRPNVEFSAKVRLISPLVDAYKGTIKVTTGISEPPQNLGFGDAVVASFVVEQAPRLILPYSAISATKDGPSVWVIGADNKVEVRQIDVQRYESGKIVLDGGIDEGDIVVTSGSHLLYPGRTVQFEEASQ